MRKILIIFLFIIIICTFLRQVYLPSSGTDGMGKKSRQYTIFQQGVQARLSAHTKGYIEEIDVQSQINQPKELPTTGHFCVLLRQSARKYSVDYSLHPTMCLSNVIGGGNIGIIMKILVLNFFFTHE